MNALLPFLIAGVGVGAVYALSGVGLVVLYRATGVLNFAFGAIGAVSAFIAWSALRAHWPLPAAILAAVLAGALLSTAYSRWIARFLSEREPIVRSIGTLGLALILMGFANWLWGEQPRRLAFPTDAGGLDFAGTRLTWTRIISLLAAVSMMLGVALLLARTRIGLKMRALANDRPLSALLGVQVRRVDTLSWLISGAFAGVCGILLANMVRLHATQLTFLVIPAFAAAIIGHLNSLPVTVAAGLAIGILEALGILVPGFAAFRTSTPFLLALVAILFFRNTSRQA